MPQAIAGAVVAATSLTGIGATIATTALGLALSFGFSQITGALFKPKTPSQKPPEGRLNMRQEAAPHRQRVVGLVKISGPLAFVRSQGPAGGDKDVLHMVVLLAGHRIKSFQSYWADQREVTIDANGDATDDYYLRNGDAFISIYPHLGEADQEADAQLVSEVSDWTENHRLRGIAYAHVRLDHNDWQTGQKVYANGVPQMKFVIEGTDEIYDPRTGASGYSTNAALAVAWFMNTPRQDGGLGIPWSKIDTDALIAAANRCDEDVELKAGGTEKRYTCNGAWELDERPMDVLAKLLSAMAGVVVWTGGKWEIHAGGWDEPTLTLTEADLRGDIVVDDAVDAFDEINGVRGTFFSPDRHWQPTDFPPYQNASYVTADGGDELWKDVEYNFTTSVSTAQRLAKIELERNRRGKVVRFPAKITVLPVGIHEVVKVTMPRFGWDEKTFRVESWSLVTDQGVNGNEGWAVDLVLREEDESVWDWNPAFDEKDFEVAPAANTDSTGDVDVPTDATVTSSEAISVPIEDNFVLLGRAQLTWTAPANNKFVNQYLIEWNRDGDGEDVLSGAAYVPGTATDYIVDSLIVGAQYAFTLKAVSGKGILSEAVVPTGSPVTIAGDSTVPAAPSAFDAVSDEASPPTVTVTWTTPSDSDYRRTRIYRSETNDSGTAVEITAEGTRIYKTPNESASYIDTTAVGGTTYYYWGKSEDFGGNLSAFSATASLVA